LKGNTGTISDYSNVPYENVVYKDMNSVGRQWVRRYTLALAKEMLGYIRGKYSTLPIPGAEITLNGSDLISAATTEKEGLITELKEILDTMSRQAQLERKQAEAEALQSQFNKMPMKIYIG
jgi:C4-type Zn-finger protein